MLPLLIGAVSVRVGLSVSYTWIVIVAGALAIISLWALIFLEYLRGDKPPRQTETAEVDIEELKAERDNTLARARERGSDLQQVLIYVNSGGLIAAFSLAGVLDSTKTPLWIFVPPTLFFFLGVTMGVLSIIRSAWTQEQRLKLLDELIDDFQEIGGQEAKRKLDEHNKQIGKLVRTGLPLEVVGYLSFGIGVLVGVIALVEVSV